MASLLANLLIGEAQGDPGPSADVMTDIVHQTLRPKLRITFLDGAKETIDIPIEWANNRYMHGSTSMPGWFPDTPESVLRQIGGPIGGVSGGEWAVERIISDRYEMQDRSNVYVADPEQDAVTPRMAHRSFEWEFLNDHDPAEEGE